MKDLSNHYIGREYNEYPPDGGCFGSFVAAVVALLICAFITMFTGCTRTEYVTKEVPVVMHDTLTEFSIKADTLIVNRHDSVWRNVYVKGDTVFVETGRNSKEDKYSGKAKHDTIRVYVNVPVEVEKETIREVPAEISKWQHLLMALGYWMIASIVIFLIFAVAYIYGIFSGRKK